MTETIFLIPQACGAKYYIKEEFLDETDVDDVVVALVNLARKVSSYSMYSLFLIKLPIYPFFIFFIFCWRRGALRILSITT